MAQFVINGGKSLRGAIAVSGAKNAVLPLMAATLLTSEPCQLTNVPKLSDVKSMLEILKGLGVKASFSGDKLELQAESVASDTPDPSLVAKFRGSIILLGPLLARLGTAHMGRPGGDNIGKRPITAHLKAFEALGVTVAEGEGIGLSVKKLLGNKIVLEESSVTATENALLASVLAEGTTVIKLAAMEPHAQQLVEFLNKMGAQISGIGSPTLTINGVKKLHGASIKVIPDSEEAASLITLAAASKSELSITNLDPDFLEDYFLKIRNIGVEFKVEGDVVHVMPPTHEYQGIKIQCGLYPKLNSDYLPPMAVLATQSRGETMMHEWLYEDRAGYVEQLNKMGAKAEILDPHRVRILGPTALSGIHSTSYDLRMGITLVIAALVASGQSEISNIDHIDRGYANLEHRLQQVGADIKRI